MTELFKSTHAQFFKLLGGHAAWAGTKRSGRFSEKKSELLSCFGWGKNVFCILVQIFHLSLC